MQEGAFHLFGGDEKAFARAGQPGAGGAAVEQLGAERGFERSDAAAGGGVVEAEPARGGDELAGSGDGEEDAYVVQSMQSALRDPTPPLAETRSVSAPQPGYGERLAVGRGV